MQQGIAVIPKSNNHDRLVAVRLDVFIHDGLHSYVIEYQNLECSAFELSPEDLRAISGLNLNLRMNDPVDIDPRLAIFA